MRLMLGLAALVFAAAVSGCSGKSGALAPLQTTPAEVEAYVAKLAAEPFKSDAKAAPDLAGVRDALPKAVSLSWGALDLDAATGASVLTDVKVSPANMPDIGLRLAEVRLWDFDAELAKARLSGRRLGETRTLARRIEAKGATVFGLETLIGPAMQAYTGALDEAVASLAPDAPPTDMKLEKYEFSIARLILTDVTLRPFELKPAQLAPDSEFATIMPIIQPFAAITSSFAVDSYAMSGVKAQLAMSQTGQAMAIDAGIESIGYRGIRGADADAGFIRNVTFEMSMPNGFAEPETGVTTPPLSMTGGIDYMSQEGARFDKLYGYLARGEWPPRSDTDLLSYGLIIFKNEHVSMNGHKVFSIGEGVFDARGWHWFIPTKVRLAASDLVYDIGGLMQMVEEMAPTLQSEATADAAPATIPPEVMAMMTKYGLDKPSLDMSLGWSWNPMSGAAVIDASFGLDSYLRFNLKYDGGFPSFKAVSDLVPEDPSKADGDAIGKVFEAATTLKGFEFNLLDEGGLDKIFALAVEVGKMIPPDQMGGMAAFANQTPESLRTMVKALADMGATQAETAMPGAGRLVSPFAAWVEAGGKVSVTAKPRTPVAIGPTGAQLETGQTSPAALLEQLNLNTVHVAPVAPKGK